MHENRTISLEQAPSAKVQRWNVLCKGMQKYKTCPRPDWQKQHLQSPELSRCARMSKTSALDVSFSNDVEKSVNPGKYKYKLPKRHAVNWWYTCNRLASFKTPILHQTKLHCTPFKNQLRLIPVGLLTLLTHPNAQESVFVCHGIIGKPWHLDLLKLH